jgi:hypothetical protein
MATAPRHTLMFQLCTGPGALRNYFKKRFIAERSHYCECSQLEIVEHISRDCVLYSAERSWLRKVSPELDLQVLDTKKGLGTVVMFLDSLPHFVC